MFIQSTIYNIQYTFERSVSSVFSVAKTIFRVYSCLPVLRSFSVVGFVVQVFLTLISDCWKL